MEEKKELLKFWEAVVLVLLLPFIIIYWAGYIIIIVQASMVLLYLKLEKYKQTPWN